MNQYLKNLNKIEFVLTSVCSGRCKHCSQGERNGAAEYIDPELAADAVRKVVAQYDIKTVMTFGGEPLLHADALEQIMSVASELGVLRRQLITNGYFSNDKKEISNMAHRLSLCGINDLLLSVDAFHQETIPLDTVRIFAQEVKKQEIPIRLQPVWLKGVDDENIYNRKTREILGSFDDLNIPISDGNIIFPEGNALKYLSQYFSDDIPKNPYIEDPCDIHCLSFSSNGDVLDGNIYKNDVIEILNNYRPN